MFSLFNGMYDSFLAPTQLNLLVVGASTSGKSAFLERLKVTDIPTKAGGRAGTTHTNARIGTEEMMTQTLYQAFVKTGAVDIAGRRKSSILKMTRQTSGGSAAAGSNSEADDRVAQLNKKLQNAEAVAAVTTAMPTPSTQPAVVIQQKKKRFLTNICPAPERYSRSAQGPR